MPRKPPPKQSVTEQATDFLWGSKTRKIVTSMTAAFGLVAAAGSAIAQFHHVDPYFPAHRGYVVEQVGQLTPTVNQLLIWQAEDSIGKLDSERAAWEIKLPNETDPQTRTMIQQRIRDLREKHNDLEARIRKLRGN